MKEQHSERELLSVIGAAIVFLLPFAAAIAFHFEVPAEALPVSPDAWDARQSTGGIFPLASQGLQEEDGRALSIPPFDRPRASYEAIPASVSAGDDGGYRSEPPWPMSTPPLVPETVLGTDGRTRITATTTYPWRTITKLWIYTDTDATADFICSGAIIDNFHVLTAGHCVNDLQYDSTNGFWARSVQVVPGMNNGDDPLGEAWATNMRSYTGWVDDRNDAHDWAVLTLDRNIGAFTGWMGRETASFLDPIYSGVLNTAGYPGDLDNGLNMYFDSDDGRLATLNNHWYYMDTAGGQSGGPVWRYDGTERYIQTVHAYGDDGSGSNHGTRLNGDKYDRIITWLNADAPTPPTDRADLLDDGQTWSGFSPTIISPGITSIAAFSDVRNKGTASSGTFTVSYYASTNTIISTTDHLIGSVTVSSIAPFNWRDADLSVVFPGGVPDGVYWVGWLIDSGDSVTEFREDNNVAYKDSYQLIVDGTPPSGSISIDSGSAWTTTTSVTLTLTYSDATTAVDSVRYSTDGTFDTEPWESPSATKTWTLDLGDGTKTVWYQIRDLAGNLFVTSDDIGLDGTPPDSAADSLAAYSNAPVVTVTATVTDAFSGAAEVELFYRQDGGSWLSYVVLTALPWSWNFDTATTGGDGVYEFLTVATDEAGNVEFNAFTADASTTIDTVAPSSLASLSGSIGSNSWYTTPVAITLAASDATSGVATVFYRLDGGSWVVYTGDFTVTTDAVHTMEYYSEDAAGNVESTNLLELKIDKTPPAFTSASPSGIVTTSEVRVSWSANDDLAGMSHFEVSVDGAAFQTVGQGTFILVSVSDGAHVVVIRAIDLAGNVNEEEVKFSVDTNIFSPTGPYGGIPLYALIAAIVLVLILLLFIARRRRR